MSIHILPYTVVLWKVLLRNIGKEFERLFIKLEIKMFNNKSILVILLTFEVCKLKLMPLTF